MSLKWPDKDKDEQLGYSVDWSRFLGDDTITSVTWSVDDASDTKTAVPSTDMPELVNGLNFIEQTQTDTVATITLADGTNNKRYKVYCKINTTEGLIYERSIFLRVKEK